MLACLPACLWACQCRVEAAPAYLRARVRRGVALPSIEIGKEADEDAAQKKRVRPGESGTEISADAVELTKRVVLVLLQVRAKEKAAASPGQQAEEDEVSRQRRILRADGCCCCCCCSVLTASVCAACLALLLLQVRRAVLSHVVRDLKVSSRSSCHTEPPADPLPARSGVCVR